MRTPGRLRTTLAIGLLAAVLAAARASGSPADRVETATGTIARVQASERLVVLKLADGGEARFVWNADTKISGVLTPGARSTIRYSPGSGGQNLALQISVSRN